MNRFKSLIAGAALVASVVGGVAVVEPVSAAPVSAEVLAVNSTASFGSAPEVKTEDLGWTGCKIGFKTSIYGRYIGGWSLCTNLYHRVWVDCKSASGSVLRVYATYFSRPGYSSQRTCPSTRPQAIRVGRQTSSSPVTVGFGSHLDHDVIAALAPQYPSNCSFMKYSHSGAVYCRTMDSDDGYRVDVYARDSFGHTTHFLGGWAVQGDYDGSYVATGSWYVISVGVIRQGCCFHRF